MAAQFAFNRPSRVQGLVFWAAYPASNSDVSRSPAKVVSIYGTRDDLATPKNITSFRALLPSTTRWVSLAGGNHAQFGWYGQQPGDNPAEMSREEQQEQVTSATVRLLESLLEEE